MLANEGGFLIRGPASKVNNHIRETVGDGAISCGKQQHHYNEYSAKERADIGKYAVENGATKEPRMQLSHTCVSMPNANTRTLKLEITSAYKI